MSISLIFILFAVIALILFSILFLVFIIFATVVSHYQGAPYVPSSKEKIAVMLRMAGIKPGDRVVDFGSGDGTLVIEAARRGAYAVGIEINPFLVFWSRFRIRRLGLSENARIVSGDFRIYPIRDADVVFLYLWPETLVKLQHKLASELKLGVRIVSNAFRFPDWKPKKEENGVFLYCKK